MSTLLTIIMIIICPILSYFYWTDNPQTRSRLKTRRIRIIYIINTISLLSCCVYYFFDKLHLDTKLQGSSLAWLFYIPSIPAIITIILRLFFLPYIHSAIWIVPYILYLKDNAKPQKETTRFIILSILSIIGCVFMELAYHDFFSAMMSV